MTGRALVRPAAAQAAQEEVPDSVALGIHMPEAFDDPERFEAIVLTLGRTPAHMVWYDQWSGGGFGEWHQRRLRQTRSWGVTPVIVWEPMDPHGDPVNQPAFQLANIIRGDFDAYIDAWAVGLAEFGEAVFLSFGPEMNGNWNPWGVGVNGNRPGEFVRAWRRIHRRFADAGAVNVRWLWVPNEEFVGVPAPAAAVYPGDDVVDWFGMNGFNWGSGVYWRSCDCMSAWRSFDEVFDTIYGSLETLGDKPMMIVETASSEVGGDKAGWITNALLSRLPNDYPRVRAFTWFNTATHGLEMIQEGVVVPTATVDWPVNSSEEALQAFVTAANTPYYQGVLP